MTIEYESRYGVGNRYIVVQEDRYPIPTSTILLECVWFCGKEDLGDQIYCTHEGQQIWVAKYFFDHGDITIHNKD